MAVYVGFESALRYWLTRTDSDYEGAIATPSLERSDVRHSSLINARLPLEFSDSRPLDVIIPTSSQLVRRSEIKCHLWSRPIPSGAFCPMNDHGAYVASPEMTFLQLAARRSTASLIRIGDLLTSSYCYSEDGKRIMPRGECIASRGSILYFLKNLKGQYGFKASTSAAEHIVDNTASPIEIMLCMMFGLPKSIGGYGLGPVLANEAIAVDRQYRGLLGIAGKLHGDLYFPELKLDIEYDSKQWHAQDARLDHTMTRRNVLEAMGIKTISATWGQINTWSRFEAFVPLLCKRAGIPLPTATSRQHKQQMNLYAELMQGLMRPPWD